MSGPLRTIYFGTPEFAVPTLEALAGDARFDVALVVTQPDRPAGRGRRQAAPAVKVAADRLGLPVYQPISLRAAAQRQRLVEVEADLFLVAAFGLIFGRATLAIPRLGALNLHASLLPAYRGASPIAAAILGGERRTGISLMKMETGLDTGPVIATAALDISPEDTTESLTRALADLAVQVAADAIPRYAAGTIEPVAQPAMGGSLTRPLTRADGWLDWRRGAEELERQVRAMWPWPRARTTHAAQPLQVHSARWTEEAECGHPGKVVRSHGELRVCCGAGSLVLDTVQPAGGRPMTGNALLAGRRIQPGDILGQDGAPEDRPPIVRSLDPAGSTRG